jgi:UDPglucose 6-dehydrogenase
VALDERFWRLIGLYLAEGHCTTDGRRRRLYWSLHPTAERELVDEIHGYLSDLDIKHDVRRTPTTMSISLSSRLWAGLFLHVLRLGGDCYTHRLPDLAWTADARDRWALLSGLWMGDGSWSDIAGGPSVVLEYGTVSRELADGMLRLLSDAGIVARLKIARLTKSTRDTCFLIVSGADQIERTIALVKPADREEVLASLQQQQKRIAPTGHRTGKGTRLRVTGTKPVFHQGYVYSLEVPGAHTVVTTDGLVVHNCFPKDAWPWCTSGAIMGWSSSSRRRPIG